MASSTFFWGETPEEEYYASQGVKNTKSFFPTPYGRLFTQSWIPSSASSSSSTRGLVFCTHGYGSDSSWMFQKVCIPFAQWGFSVYAADVIGHGQSDGIPGYIADVESTAAASLLFYQSVRDMDSHQHLKKFLLGESMGGGLTFLMILQDPKGWDGVIFCAPLFVMPKEMTPSPWRLFWYSLLLGFAETWAVMPMSNVRGKAFKDPEKAKVVLANPRRYKMPARVGTMRQLRKMCDIFQKRCGEVEVPFLVVHGTGDNITDYVGGQILSDRARSSDKTVKIYDDLYHSLIQAENDESIALVLSDIKAWIDAHTPVPHTQDP